MGNKKSRSTPNQTISKAFKTDFTSFFLYLSKSSFLSLIVAQDEIWWNDFFSFFATHFSSYHISHALARLFITAQPKNCKVMFRKIIERLQSFLHKPSASQTVETLSLIYLMERVISILLEPQFASVFHETFWHMDSSNDEPLGRTLLHLLMKLAFLPGFTIHPSQFSLFPRTPSDRPLKTEYLWYITLFLTLF